MTLPDYYGTISWRERQISDGMPGRRPLACLMQLKSLAVDGIDPPAHQLGVPVRQIRRRGTSGEVSQSFTILQNGDNCVGHGAQVVRRCNQTIDAGADHVAKTWEIASNAGLAASEILHDYAGQSLSHGTEQA